MKKLIWPDYKNCTANLPNSILKKFGAPTAGDTLPLLDKYLDRDYRNIVVLLLDGMGKHILEHHLKADGPFRSHLAGIYQSVFLSTTVAATTSVQSGLQPCEHCWLGWDCYYPQIDQNVTVFFSLIQGTDKPAADFNVPLTFTPYENVLDKLNNAGTKAYRLTPYDDPAPGNIEEFCRRIKALCDEPDRKYVFAYWDEPDGLLHDNGCKSAPVHEALVSMENAVQELAGELEDTLIIVTADHGHIDTDLAALPDYPELMDCLVRTPSLEPRVINFFVKEEKKAFFEKEFNRLFGEKFLLLTKEEVIERQLFGTAAPRELFKDMLGNYIAIATDTLSICSKDQTPRPNWKSMHGSVTEDEVLVPLILFDCNGNKRNS